jgi:hypothetical protein
MIMKFQEVFTNAFDFFEMNPVDFSEATDLTLDEVCGLLDGTVYPDQRIAEGIVKVFGGPAEDWLKYER